MKIMWRLWEHSLGRDADWWSYNLMRDSWGPSLEFCVMGRVQFSHEIIRYNQHTRAKYLLSKLKYQEEPGIFLFISNQENFHRVNKMNRKKISDDVKFPEMILTDVCIKFPASMMILTCS